MVTSAGKIAVSLCLVFVVDVVLLFTKPKTDCLRLDFLRRVTFHKITELELVLAVGVLDSLRAFDGDYLDFKNGRLWFLDLPGAGGYALNISRSFVWLKGLGMLVSFDLNLVVPCLF